MIKLSGYKIIKKIGSGGMGDVYLAEHEKLEKKVAIKSLHNNLATDTSFRERFSQEAKTHSKLDHPNIVKLLDYKERKDGLFLVMEYVDGKQLDEHIKKVSGPIPEKELTTLFTQILDAIGYAHKQGLVHRDIKPSNIMIDKEGRIKVLDFGIAKMQEEEKGLTKTGMQIGTATYMSPEQVNAKKVDKLSDIYSLGVTLYYMAVGKSPYDGETNTFSIQTKIVSDPFPIAHDAYPGVSERFEQIIHKATQKKKKDRYQSCEAFKSDFDTTKKIKKVINKANPKKNLFNFKWNKKIFIAISLIMLIVGLFFIPQYFVEKAFKNESYNEVISISKNYRKVIKFNKKVNKIYLLAKFQNQDLDNFFSEFNFSYEESEELLRYLLFEIKNFEFQNNWPLILSFSQQIKTKYPILSKDNVFICMGANIYFFNDTPGLLFNNTYKECKKYMPTDHRVIFNDSITSHDILYAKHLEFLDDFYDKFHKDYYHNNPKKEDILITHGVWSLVIEVLSICASPNSSYYWDWQLEDASTKYLERFIYHAKSFNKDRSLFEESAIFENNTTYFDVIDKASTKKQSFEEISTGRQYAFLAEMYNNKGDIYMANKYIDNAILSPGSWYNKSEFYYRKFLINWNTKPYGDKNGACKALNQALDLWLEKDPDVLYLVRVLEEDILEALNATCRTY